MRLRSYTVLRRTFILYHVLIPSFVGSNRDFLGCGREMLILNIFIPFCQVGGTVTHCFQFWWEVRWWRACSPSVRLSSPISRLTFKRKMWSGWVWRIYSSESSPLWKGRSYQAFYVEEVKAAIRDFDSV